LGFELCPSSSKAWPFVAPKLSSKARSKARPFVAPKLNTQGCFEAPLSTKLFNGKRMIEDIRVRVRLVSLSLPSPPFGGFQSISFFNILSCRKVGFQPWPGRRILRQYSITRGFFRVHMNGQRGWANLDRRLRGMPSATHQLLFCFNFRGMGNTHLSLVSTSYQQMNAFGPYNPVNLSIKWTVSALKLRSIVIQKQFSCHSKISGFTIRMFYLPEWHQRGPKRPCMTWSPKAEKKRPEKWDPSYMLVVFNCKVTNGSRKVHGVRMAFACRSFRSSCGPYKAHGSYAMFLH
jgi:hypothetical protein